MAKQKNSIPTKTSPAHAIHMKHQNDSLKKDLCSIAVITSIFIAMILFARLYKLYPVDDDWSYMRAVETFFKSGQMKFTPWTSPSLVFQVLWGSFFSWIFGFSANTLVLSTQVITCLGMIFFYLLTRETGCRPAKALMLTLLLVFNPFSFPLTYTFFTDQHFIALMLISTYLYYRGVSRQNSLYLFAGSVAASLSVLVRQPGLLVAAATGICLIARKDKVSRIFISCLLPLSAFIIFTYWFQDIHGQTFTAKQQMKWIIECLGSPVYIISKFFNRPFIILDFFGFCLIPFSLSILPGLKHSDSSRNVPVILLFCLSGILLYLVGEHIGIPSSVYDWKKGFHFAYVSEYGFRGASNNLLFFYKLLDFAAVLSITLLAWLLIQSREQARKVLASPLLLLILIPLLQFIFLMIVRYKFTRYYLVLLPFFIILTAKLLSDITIKWRYFVPLLAGFAAFSICVTQDFMSWNQAHWKLGEKAIRQGIPVRKLSGGFPWDCWHNMEYCMKNPYDIKTRTYDIPWWLDIMTPAIDPQYLLSCSPVPTGFYMFKYFCLYPYRAIEAEQYFSLLYGKNMKVLLLERQPSTAQYDKAANPCYYMCENLAAATRSSEKHNPELENSISVNSIRIGSATRHCIVQPARTGIKFKLSLPPEPCRLRTFLSTEPETWTKGGDGLTFRIMLDNNMFENLFDSTGMAGETAKLEFLKPRGFFLRSRPIYINYIDPKNNIKERKWEPVALDLSRFSGRTVELELVIEPGPMNNDIDDVALWGEPVIETY